MKKLKRWNRCDDCGRFIAYKDFYNGASHTMVLPDSECSIETYETRCIKCNQNKQVTI